MAFDQPFGLVFLFPIPNFSIPSKFLKNILNENILFDTNYFKDLRIITLVNGRIKCLYTNVILKLFVNNLV